MVVSDRSSSYVYMPESCPSFHLMPIAYEPIDHMRSRVVSCSIVFSMIAKERFLPVSGLL